MNSDNVHLDRLWMKGFSKDLSDDEVHKFCEKLCEVKIVHISRPLKYTFIFMSFASEEDAKQALFNIRAKRHQANYVKKTRNTTGFTSPSQSTSQPNSSPRSKLVNLSNKNTNRPPIQSSNNAGVLTNNNNSVNIVPGKYSFHNGEEVIITHIENASLFYAIPAAQNQQYKELLEMISELGKTANSLREIPRMVLVPYENQFYRGIPGAVDTFTNLVSVRLVDIGVKIDVPSCELKSIPKNFTTIRITYPFKLEGIEDDTSNTYVTNCLKSYIGKKLKMEFDGQVQPRSNVRLIDPVTQTSINRIINDINSRYIYMSEVTRNPVPIGKNKLLVTIDDSSLKEGFNLLTFINKMHLKEWNQQLNQIQSVGKSMDNYPAYVTNIDELCLAKLNELWYRGRLLEIDSVEQKALVLLIDHFKAVKIDSKDIRNITADLAKLHVLTFAGAIVGFQDKIDQAKVDKIIHKFEANNMIAVKSISESEDKEIYAVEL